MPIMDWIMCIGPDLDFFAVSLQKAGRDRENCARFDGLGRMPPENHKSMRE
jgi:hypothetical protein